MSTALQTLTSKLATRLEIGDSSGLIETLKSTAFKGQVSDAQMTALMIVANQYSLNPWTKEIYAFPDKNNGIVPVVGVDGWSRIINSNDKFDGMEFEQNDESCTCIIYRKDRSHPIKVTEYMSECRRSNVGPWQSHPKRMLRHKAMIQCARLAFGFGGIYDQDEAERLVESRPVEKSVQGEVVHEHYPQDKFETNFPKWSKRIELGEKTAEQYIEWAMTLTDEQQARLRAVKPVIEAEVLPGREDIAKAIASATSRDEADAAIDLASGLDDETKKALIAIYNARIAQLEGEAA